MNLNPNNRPLRTDESEQYLLNLSFDRVFQLLMVGLAGYNSTSQTYDRIQVDGTGGLKTSSADQTSRYDLQDPVYYLGSAPVGTSEATASWSVTKVDASSNPITAKVAQNVAWADRTGATYV